MMVLMLERLEKRPGAIPAVFPLPIFTGTASISMFRVSPPPSLANDEVGLYIGILGQAEHQEKKMDIIGASRPKWAWVAWSGLVATPPVLVWPSWPTSLTSCTPEGSRDKILTPKKS
jgi:hypothetical protein